MKHLGSSELLSVTERAGQNRAFFFFCLVNARISRMCVAAHTEISHKMFSDFGRKWITEINLAFDI